MFLSNMCEYTSFKQQNSIFLPLEKYFYENNITILVQPRKVLKVVYFYAHDTVNAHDTVKALQIHPKGLMRH